MCSEILFVLSLVIGMPVGVGFMILLMEYAFAGGWWEKD